MINIGIMGFGRIGRDIYRLASNHKQFNITAIGDVADPEILYYLLASESPDFSNTKLNDNYLENGHMSTRMVRAIEPGDVPWEVFQTDFVVDATHKYRSREDLQKHLDGGANRVIMSSLPQDKIDKVIVVGVNEMTIHRSDTIISAGSSTTNALILALHILLEKYSIEAANMTSIHSYTSDQPLQDVAGKDFRRSRSAAENIIPNDSESLGWVGKILPVLKGKISASALNVPVQKGSLLDLSVALIDGGITSDDIISLFESAAEKKPALIEVNHDPIVSSDVIGNTHTLVFDSQATMTTGADLIKILAWYDNGLSQAGRILDIIQLYHSLEKEGGTE
ncbi:MAG: glyceraldehyde 3-phosphate dehydrogenase NAD-binding domain-containing protein [Candidatus Marinimicrobia bacterium]|nr:glyceraldehyde 3-phosphate dehydrogenase NAD-binding domain-containing protein [Candidatus Neomarinimicrobiota bacterium]